MIDADELPAYIPSKDRVRESCSSWLRYTSLEKRRKKRDEISAGIAYLGAVTSHSTAERVGSFRPALREAQFYWAAARLNPMLRAAAFAVRNMRTRKDVTYYLYLNYRNDWLEWKASRPEYAYRALLLNVAEEMAAVLGDDIY